MPASIQGVLFSVSNMLIQSFVNLFGTDAIAGNAAALNIESIIYIMLDAVRHTAMTFISQNYGAGEFVRIKKYSGCALYMRRLLTGQLCCREKVHIRHRRAGSTGWDLRFRELLRAWGRKLKKNSGFKLGDKVCAPYGMAMDCLCGENVGKVVLKVR